MKHSNTFSISDKAMEIIKTTDSPQELFDQTKKYIIEDEIVSLLNNYDHYQDTHGQVYTVEIVAGEMNRDGIGWMQVEYEVHYYFGCEDLNKEYEEEMIIEISVDFHNMEITITGENEEKREPDEY